jgi:predicted nucleic acid-binding protein
MNSDSVVIDSNIFIGTLLQHPMRVQCRALLAENSANQHVYAPTLWLYEVTSTLTRAVRDGNIAREEAQQAIDKFLRYGVHLIAPDQRLSVAALDWTLRLNRAAAYDSFYLALAQSLNCDFWTADRKLVRAVNEPWVRWIGDLQF